MTKHKINQLLDERGMTRYALAKKANLSFPSVYRIVDSDEIPPKTYWETIEKLRDALGLEHVEDMLEDESENSV